MRILPIPIFFRHLPTKDMLNQVHRILSMTHQHPHAQIACGIYSLVILNLQSGMDVHKTYHEAVVTALGYYWASLEFRNQAF